MNQFVTIFVSAGAGLISGVILHWLRIRLDPSARLVWAVTHQAAFPIESPNRIAVTRTVLIANGGRAAAEDVEIVYAFRPQLFIVQPPRQFTDVPLANSHTVRFAHLGPRQQLAIAELAVVDMKGELPLIVDVRCRGFPARQVPALPQRVFPLWIRVIFAGRRQSVPRRSSV